MPVAVSGLAGVRAISAGLEASCALMGDGTVECWGYELGSVRLAASPVAVSGLAGVQAIAVGGDHACALASGGGVECWGANGADQLGNGSAPPVFRSTPTTFPPSFF